MVSQPPSHGACRAPPFSHHCSGSHLGSLPWARGRWGALLVFPKPSVHPSSPLSHCVVVVYLCASLPIRLWASGGQDSSDTSLSPQGPALAWPWVNTYESLWNECKTDSNVSVSGLTWSICIEDGCRVARLGCIPASSQAQSRALATVSAAKCSRVTHHVSSLMAGPYTLPDRKCRAFQWGLWMPR